MKKFAIALMMLLASLPALAAPHSIVISWDAPIAGQTYNVKRSAIAGGPYTTQVTNLTALTYTDAGLAPLTKLCYVVSATLTGVESANSAEVCGTTLADPVLPQAPTNLRVTKIQ